MSGVLSGKTGIAEMLESDFLLAHVYGSLTPRPTTDIKKQSKIVNTFEMCRFLTLL